MEAAPLSQSTAPEPASAGLRTVILVAMAVFAGGLLRIWMLKKFFEVNGDSQIYGGLAQNLLLHARYAVSDGNGSLHTTLIRLPGYPLFLAACFRMFGMENYFAASCVQIVLEMAGCLMLADFVRRVSGPRFKSAAAHSTLWLAALCPFTAIYAVEPLTESLTLFTIALALWAAVQFQDRPTWSTALAFTFAVTYAALLRPDGALVGIAFAPALALGALKERQSPGPYIKPRRSDAAREVSIPRKVFGFRLRRPSLDLVRMALVCLLLALTPFVAWSWRNWRVFHVFEPLAPRYATDPGEDTNPGWQRWMKTWCLDFVSTYTIYWNVPEGPLDLSALPSRAFDSPAQYAETAKIVSDYQADGQVLTADLDARFARLADERIAAHPLRYYVELPLGRMADMWLRPRVENLPIDLDWWVYAHHNAETRFSWFYAALNAFYLVLGLVGLCLRPRLWPWMLAYMLLRSALLSTIEAPEARYTLECFPMLFALGGVALSHAFRRLRPL